MRPAPLRPAAAPAATPVTAAQPQRYLTNDEAADYLRLSPRTLGETFGVNTVTLNSNQIPQHNHGINAYVPGNSSAPVANGGLSQPSLAANKAFAMPGAMRWVSHVRNLESPFWIGNLRHVGLRCLIPSSTRSAWRRSPRSCTARNSSSAGTACCTPRRWRRRHTSA